MYKLLINNIFISILLTLAWSESLQAGDLCEYENENICKITKTYDITYEGDATGDLFRCYASSNSTECEGISESILFPNVMQIKASGQSASPSISIIYPSRKKATFRQEFHSGDYEVLEKNGVIRVWLKNTVIGVNDHEPGLHDTFLYFYKLGDRVLMNFIVEHKFSVYECDSDASDECTAEMKQIDLKIKSHNRSHGIAQTQFSRSHGGGISQENID